MATGTAPQSHALPERVALVAVHGVADQKPGETAQALADQLSGLENGDPQAARYIPWKEDPVRIPVTPVPLGSFATSRLMQNPFTGFAKLSRGAHSEFASQYFGAQSPENPALEFMATKLAGYRGGDRKNATYATTRLRSERMAHGGWRADVDVYELYWADLSRLGTGVLRIFSEFYQLLFHLTILGRLTVDLARASPDNKASGAERWTWSTMSELHATASWVLSVPIALLNVLLVLLATIFLPLAVPHEWRPLAAALIFGGVGACLVARWRVCARLPLASVWSVACGVAIAVLAFALLCWITGNRVESGFGGTQALALAWIIAVAAATIWIARGLDRQIPGAAWVGWLLALAVAAVFGGIVVHFGRNTRDDVMLRVMGMVDGIFTGLLWLWILLVLLHVAAWLAGAAAWCFADGPSRRAIRTGRLGIAVPVGMFLLVTLTGWAVLKGTIVGFLPEVDYRPHSERISAIPLSPPEYIDRLLEMSAGAGFNVLFLLIVLGVLCLLWAVLPSLVAELKPPDAQDGKRSAGMGAWLDEGLGWGVIGTAILVFAAVFWLPLAQYMMERLPALREALGGHKTLIVLGGVLTGTAVGMLALGRYTDVLLKGVRSVLDIALDVDQWLREQPNEGTPCARICARYASLLRYIIEWRGPDGRGYDRVVIVAHSQGTIITAELLRFITAGHVEQRDALNRLGRSLPVRLMTVGSPLRQLYSRRFPHLYDWAAAPAIAEIGAERWANAYFSGDYVGRYLWRGDGDARNWNPVQSAWRPWTADPAVDQYADGRTELCLGAGAHTHYFDGESPLVARTVDALLA